MTLPLGLDKDFIPILPAIWYCLHMPRTASDLRDFPAKGMKTSQQLNLPHNIQLVPIPCPPSFLAALSKSTDLKMILLPDDLAEAASDMVKNIGVVIDTKLVSELSEATISSHWNSFHSALDIKTPTYIKPSLLLSNSPFRATLLPAHFVARQLLGGTDNSVPHEFASNREAIYFSLENQAVLSTIALMETKGLSQQEAEKVYQEEFRTERNRFKCPVAIGIPGVAPDAPTRKMAKVLRMLDQKSDVGFEMAEKSALEFLVAHRALARSGIGLVTPRIEDELFRLLSRLEKHWATGNPRPHVVRRMLDQLSQHAERLFTEEYARTLRHASFLTCFSEFPLGLCRLPGDSSPLCSRVAIAYRPIVPLTRALQNELSSIPIHFLKTHLNILIAECISPNDPVGRMSRAGWKIASETLTNIANTKFRDVDIANVSQLREELRKEQVDILVISAHGGIHSTQNRTGFNIGGQLVMEEELGPLPSVVCLSACQVSPRGNGTINVTDLMFRQGAVVVLGTFVPIDVRRNSVLMVRFFVNIAATMTGEMSLSTLGDVWHHTVTGNAVNDILLGSPGIQRWGFEKNKGVSVVEEFMRKRSRGRLRGGHIYEDTITILQEIADDWGTGVKFRAWIENQGYLPESLFYAILGWPERIVLRDPLIERMSDLEGIRPGKKRKSPKITLPPPQEE